VRLAVLRALEGGALGLVVARLSGRSIPIAATLAGVGALIGVAVAYWRRPRLTREIEARAPECRNLLITADELERDPRGAREPVRSVVLDQASRLVAGLDPARLFPAWRSLAAVAIAILIWLIPTAASTAASRALSTVRRSAGGIDGIDVTITPPPYAAATYRAQSLRDPTRIAALAGSRIRLTVRARDTGVTVETIRGRESVTGANGTYTAHFGVDTDGFVAIQTSSDRRLIGLTVTPDTPPRVRVTAPGRDLILPDGRRAIDLAVDADDDVGLASLRLRYTRVSGSGERFTFTEGEVPLAIQRRDGTTWSARASWHLDSLQLDAGDMVVYRAVAADARPGATPTESDSWIAEVAAPGGVAAAGFALDPEQERYAVSQQMVILKTERLLARKPSMPAEGYASEATDLAGEQRKVRAEFVFMMGGEVGEQGVEDANISDLNEEAETSNEDDLAAGRMANQGRVALIRAIRAMSLADRSLTAVKLDTALKHERAALAQLERAFSHSRIILRALSERERLDLSRRLTGDVSDASPAAQPSAAPEPSARVTELRGVLADIGALSALPSDAAARASRLAERLLRIDPSAPAMQNTARLLVDAAARIRASRSVEARALLGRAAIGLTHAISPELPRASERATNAGESELRGALSDALRRGGAR
jgi:hypothetical protein